MNQPKYQVLVCGKQSRLYKAHKKNDGSVAYYPAESWRTHISHGHAVQFAADWEKMFTLPVS